MNYKMLYQAKRKTAEEIASLIQSGFTCVAPTCMGQPNAITAAVTKRAMRGELENVKHHSIIAIGEPGFLDPALRGKYDYVSWFTTGTARKSVQEGYSDYMPCHYSEVAQIWAERGELDVFYAAVTPMDEYGWFSFGLIASEAAALAAQAKYVFLEVNPHMPRVPGNNSIHISQVTAFCEFESPLPILPEAPITQTDMTIGHLIAEQIPDGATIQFGIGGVPNAVGKCLRDKRDLGIHTELFVDSMVDLIQCGAVTNLEKKLHRGKSVATFGWGSENMYRFLQNNPTIELHPVSYVNDPYVIGQIDNFISVNSCLEVDLLGQVCAESIGPKHYSGSGGQVDFVRGCNRSKGGKSFIAISSTAKGGTVTKIKPTLSPGAAVTTGKNDVDYIVTEFGIARLRGKTAGERAKALISVAHPDFRDQLTFEARKMNLMV